ncbi:MAG: hypothetical protein M1820_003983 [Bogoriella megaspora]|nr:MAG: hypothetical protein M1820_003983 [Bogoriella megaspora]
MAGNEAPMMRCELCQPLTIAVLRNNEYNHHPNLVSLRDSATSGCPTCNLFWTCLAKSSIPEAINSHLNGRVYGEDHGTIKQHEATNAALTDTAIRLRGELHDLGDENKETHIESVIWVSSGRRYEPGVENLWPTSVFGRVKLYALPGTSAAKWMSGREVAVTSSNENCFQLIMQWINVCDRNHDCSIGEFPLLPKRVVDVGSFGQEAASILRETGDGGLCGKYAAVSYCWGAGQTTVTTRESFEQFKRGINISELSRSLQDAIHVTRKLGIRYIWIDALCIIQNEENLDDFKEESVKMADYYGNAYITIAVGSAASSQEGFLNQRTSSKPVSCALDYSRPGWNDGSPESRMDPSLGSVYAGLLSSSDVGPLITRGWTFQEAVLSHRLIIFGQNQIMWKCQRLECHEDGLMQKSSGLSYCSPYKWPMSTDTLPGKTQDYHSSLLTHRESPQLRKRLLLDWYNLLRQYTTRKLGNSEDKMAAMAGIAQKMAVCLESRYIFGIWEIDAIRGLLWRNGSGLGNVLRSVPLQRTNRSAPSWSWACMDGSIHVENYGHADKKYADPANHRAEIVRMRSVGSTWDPIRSRDKNDEKDQASTLIVRGVLKPAQRSDEDFLQYPIKKRWLGTFWLPNRRKCLSVVTLLESMQEDANIRPNEVIGIAVFDTAADKANGYDKLYCLRITASLGLLLIPNRLAAQPDTSALAAGSPGSFQNTQRQYSRVGVVLVEDEKWFDSGDYELVSIL